MKKIFALLLSTMIICTVFAFSGCEKDPEPYFRMYDEEAERKTIVSFHPNFSGFSFVDAYEDFLDYYDTTFDGKAEKTYLLECNFEIIGSESFRQGRDYYVYQENTGQSGEEFRYLFLEHITLYDPDYFTEPDNGNYGGYFWTVDMEYYTSPVADTVNGNDYTLEFGENYKPFEDYPGKFTKFINIYVGKICVGTCYYYERLPISTEWFENYFRENLIGR